MRVLAAGVQLDRPAAAAAHLLELRPVQREPGVLGRPGGDDEHGGLVVVASQHLVGAAVGVDAAVVEGDQDRPARQPHRPVLDECRVGRHGDGVEAGGVERFHLLCEQVPRHRQVVVLDADAVVTEDGDRARVCGEVRPRPPLPPDQRDVQSRLRLPRCGGRLVPVEDDRGCDADQQSPADDADDDHAEDGGRAARHRCLGPRPPAMHLAGCGKKTTSNARPSEASMGRTAAAVTPTGRRAPAGISESDSSVSSA